VKLHITRSQEGGPGHVRYSAQYRLELTDEEIGLLERYMPPAAVRHESRIYNDLLKTRTYAVSAWPDLRALRETDQDVRRICSEIADYVRSAAQWDGSETISF